MNIQLDHKKTKYRYFMDCVDLSVKRTAIKYTIPIDKTAPSPEGFYNRDYPVVEISYKKLVENIDKTAKALIALGVKKGDYVVMCSSNVPEMIYMDYALNKIGAIPNYIYPNITADEMKFYLNEIESHYIYMLDEPDIRNMILESVADFDIKTIIASSVLESFPLVFKKAAELKSRKAKPYESDLIVNWPDFIKGGKAVKTEVKEEPYIENAVCSLVHTSGTSKTPKAVMVTNENSNSIPRNYAIDKVDFSAGKTAVQTIPQFVEYGKATNHLYFCNNISVVLIPEMDPKNYYDLIEKFKPSHSFATPSHARELIKRPVDMSSLDIIGFGGDGFDDVEISFNQYIKNNNGNTLACQGYGSSEVSAVAITNIPGRHKVGSLGKPLGETKAKIVEIDTFNEITAPNTVGELCITGPGVTQGYAGDSTEENAKVFKMHPDGKNWVHMGDLAYFDEDGFYFYEGRIKNIIARKSFKFAPKEIEDVILKHPFVKQCVVVGKYDKEEGQVPSAHIVLNDNSNVQQTLTEIIELVNNEIQEFHRPTIYKIRKSIITTRNNKVNINALKLEDIATLFPSVNGANICISKSNDYDYDLTIYCNDVIDINSAIHFIEYIGKNEKVLNGSIKYIISKEFTSDIYHSINTL